MCGKKYFLLVVLSITVAVVFSSCAGLSDKKDTADVTITIASSTLQNVVRVTDNKFRKNAVQVSPDGAKLLYCEANETDPNKLLYLDDFRIMLLRDVNVSAKTPLVTEPSYSPVWFDDNIGYAYVAYEGSGSKLVKSNVTGGGKTYITRTSAGIGDANPNVKGDRILCDTLVGEGENQKRQLVSMRANGTEITILGEGEQPSWHPSGTKFLFVRRSEEQRGKSTFFPRSIYEMDIATNQVTQIYTAVIDEERGFTEVCSQPSYSPDGQYILFSKGGDVFLATVEKKGGKSPGWLRRLFGGGGNRSKVNVTERRLHLYLMKEDGTDLTQLTGGNVDVFSPAWGPNNDIYFISNVQNATEIWRAHLNL
jgi:Tol biopolymer transport system component